jgi:hypothetical protein
MGLGMMMGLHSADGVVRNLIVLGVLYGMRAWWRNCETQVPS